MLVVFVKGPAPCLRICHHLEQYCRMLVRKGVATARCHRSQTYLSYGRGEICPQSPKASERHPSRVCSLVATISQAGTRDQLRAQQQMEIRPRHRWPIFLYQYQHQRYVLLLESDRTAEQRVLLLRVENQISTMSCRSEERRVGKECPV